MLKFEYMHVNNVVLKTASLLSLLNLNVAESKSRKVSDLVETKLPSMQYKYGFGNAIHYLILLIKLQTSKYTTLHVTVCLFWFSIYPEVLVSQARLVQADKGMGQEFRTNTS